MVLVGWVGVKLLMHTLAHPEVHIISHDFVEGPIWNTIFWAVVIVIAAAAGSFPRRNRRAKQPDNLLHPTSMTQTRQEAESAGKRLSPFIYDQVRNLRWDLVPS